jgi:hypothetical protein
MLLNIQMETEMISQTAEVVKLESHIVVPAIIVIMLVVMILAVVFASQKHKH